MSVAAASVSPIPMPVETARTIIKNFIKTGQIEPKKRGEPHQKYDKNQIAAFLFTFISDTKNSNSTLEEIRMEISNTLFNGAQAPSCSWIYNLLKQPYFNSKPITLKIASMVPTRRNSPETLVERKEFVEWIQQLSATDLSRLVFVDEHGIQLYTVRHRARSVAGVPATVSVPTVKGKNVTNLLAVSVTFGKVTLMVTDEIVNSIIFTQFLTQLHKTWENSEKIPQKLKEIGPIIVLYNWSAHKVENTLYTFHFLPKYSPFLNPTEFVNCDHKLGIRKLFHYYKDFPEYLEQIQWGSKVKSTVKHCFQCSYMSWNCIPDSYIGKHWEHIQKTYFNSCLAKTPIMS